MGDDVRRRALDDAVRRNAESVRHLLLSCQLLNVRLGDQISDTAIIKRPERIVSYRLQEVHSN